MIRKISHSILISLLFFSCENALIEESQEPSNEEVFNYMWNTVDQKYSFFEDKNIDWDSAYRVFRPRVRSADNILELYDVLAQSLFVLKDGHVNLSAGIDFSRNWQWYLDYPPNFNWDIIERNYLVPSKDYQISGPIHNTIIDDVGYMYYPSFSSNVSTSLMNYIIQKFETGNFVCGDTCAVEGIIIDIRNNGGGSVSNAFTIANRFAGEQLKVADWYYKDGPAHDDFSEPVEKFLSFEGNEDYRFNKPVYVLTNRSSYSAANFFASMMSFLPQVTILGDVTGGGGGLPINTELPNGWLIRFSSTRTIDAAGNNIEFGVQPDIRVDLDSTDLFNGKDTMIERAIELIKATN